MTFGSGKELWRLPVPQTKSYSRDADGSGFFFDGTFYQGVESGWFYALDPLKTTAWAEGKKPVIEHQQLLLGDERAEAHGSDLVLESSPSAVGKNLYIASGAGHVYGLRRSDLKVVWDYYIGSDLDGTPVPTKKGLLLQGVEKQYIKGKGGMLALDPTKPPDKATVWFFPTGNRELGDWKGGIVGSAAVNDSYNKDGQYPALCAFSAIDGYLYVVSQDVMSDATVKGPNLGKGLKTPVQIARIWNGGAISTPIIVGESLVSASYDQRVHLFDIVYTPADEGEPGALPSASRDGGFWTVTLEERDQFFTRRRSSPRPSCGTGACTSAAAMGSCTASATSEPGAPRRLTPWLRRAGAADAAAGGAADRRRPEWLSRRRRRPCPCPAAWPRRAPGPPWRPGRRRRRRAPAEWRRRCSR